MLMTSVLLFIAMREFGGVERAAAGALAGLSLDWDAAFFLGQCCEIAEGGYVPLLLAGCVYFFMVVWHVEGRPYQAACMRPSCDLEFMAKIEEAQVPRVPGTAVFLNAPRNATPAGAGLAPQAQTGRSTKRLSY